jgi:hypothetical protein
MTLSLYLIRLGDAVPNVEQVIGGKMTGGGGLDEQSACLSITVG